MPVTRFAPSPTGYLHLGHAYSAFFATRKAIGNAFLLRIEDIDPVRCKPAFAAAIQEDLVWLGLTWSQPVRFQSQHISDYVAAFERLRAEDLVYPCFCTRREIAQEAARSFHAPHLDDGETRYPGTCRHLSDRERTDRLAQAGTANWRMDMSKAVRQAGRLTWLDDRRGEIEAKPELFGDVVLARKDVPTSYHLSVTVDDHLQGVELVTRGEDLFAATHIHRLLQALLGYASPHYEHHPLLRDRHGRRYAKRDQAVTLRALRQQGTSAADLIAHLPL